MKIKRICLILISLGLLFVSCNNMEDVVSSTKFVDETTLFNNEAPFTKKDESANIINQDNNINDENKLKIFLNIMPTYNNELYSRAYFRQYVKNNLKDLRVCYGILADKINTEEMSKIEKSIAMKNYLTIESFLLEAERDEVNEKEYEDLKKTDYIDYIKKEFAYIDKKNISNANYLIKFDTVNIHNLYYDFDCDVFMPLLISTKDVEELKKIYKEDEEEAKISMKFPITSDGMISGSKDIVGQKNIMLYYNGEDGFLYYTGNSQDEKDLREISIQPYNDDYYAFYEDDLWLIDNKDKTIKLCILKDANIGLGSSFKEISSLDDDYLFGNDDIKYYNNMKDFFNQMLNEEKTFIGEETEFKANYIQFDDKGYVVNVYNFIEE